MGALKDGVSSATRRDRESAHALKSSSANVGARRLSSLCKEMETVARTGLAEKAAGLMAAVDAEFARVQEALRTVSPGRG
jgi:HPt (histidine-containing phosphotransfer) domain-containing protein